MADNVTLPGTGTVVATEDVGGVQYQRIKVVQTSLTGSSPTYATVGVASAEAVASNANRKGLVLTNTSANFISLAFGAAAVLYSGITLAPYGVFVMDAFTFTTAQVRAIASAAGSNLAVQEFT